MRIGVIGALTFRQLIGKGQPVYIEIDEGTIKDILELLCEKYGGPLEKMIFETAKRELKTSVLLLLNGVPHWNLSHRLATEVKDGDKIELRPMAAGG